MKILIDFPKNPKIKAEFKIDTDLFALVQVLNKIKINYYLYQYFIRIKLSLFH